jgi:hypothetical protein
VTVTRGLRAKESGVPRQLTKQNLALGMVGLRSYKKIWGAGMSSSLVFHNLEKHTVTSLRVDIATWNFYISKKFWKEHIAYFPLTRHGPHRKRRVQQFVYCCVCIRCRGNVFTEPMTGNDKGIHIHTQTDGKHLWSTPFSCHGIHTKFRKHWFRYSKYRKITYNLPGIEHQPSSR